MTERTQSTIRTLIHAVQTGSLMLLATLALTGCYVEVVPQVRPYMLITDHNSIDLRRYSTAFLVEAALIPFALGSASPAMLIDPDSVTTPQGRALNRALIERTSYAYLFDDRDCDAGGYTQTEAEADTTRYDDGYTFVDLNLNAQAKDCALRSGGQLHWVNSDLNYNLSGWHDDWAGAISSITARLDGQVQIETTDSLIQHRLVNVQLDNLTSTDFLLTGSSAVWLDDGFGQSDADLTTEAAVHWALGHSFPHQGQVRLQNNSSWVDLKFATTGLWRETSSGGSHFWLWSELGFQ